MGAERLQKILALAGHGSRRACETLIATGRVHVNGQPAALGDRADAARDRITLDHSAIDLPEKFTYILLHKPREVESSLNPREDAGACAIWSMRPAGFTPSGDWTLTAKD